MSEYVNSLKVNLKNARYLFKQNEELMNCLSTSIVERVHLTNIMADLAESIEYYTAKLNLANVVESQITSE